MMKIFQNYAHYTWQKKYPGEIFHYLRSNGDISEYLAQIYRIQYDLSMKGRSILLLGAQQPEEM